MIVITVQSFNGQPIAGISASFDELGGTIGRADNNHLVLADPDRSISRIHAQVVFRNGGWAIADRGSNPVLVNGQPIGNGREAPVRDGDTVTIGGYLLGVSVGQKTVAPDPFADLFGGGAGASPAPAPRPVAAPPAVAPRSGADALFGPGDPFAAAPAGGLFAPAPAPSASFGATGSAPAIPEDWDPFAPAPAPVAAAPASPYLPDLPMSAPSQGESLDALFGLGGARAGADPFGVAAGGVPAPASDHASDLNTPWLAAPLREAPPSAPGAGPASAANLTGAVLSWNQPTRDSKVITLPGSQLKSPPAESADEPGPLTRIIPKSPSTRPLPAPAPVAAFAAPAAAASVPAPAGLAAASAPTAGADALLAAFAEGLGLPAARLQALDAAQMRLVGHVLREATRGVVDLLVARASLKREMRTEVTMIQVRENNPLKFSPSAEVALQHLLGEPMPGFMAAAPAMRDAFDDLRAHQLGVMAGMRAALDGVLQRFEPAQLESKIAAKRSALAALLPSSRKAQLWEQFQQLYAQLSAEAADDFQELFGNAFRAAYEAHIDSLHGGEG